MSHENKKTSSPRAHLEAAASELLKEGKKRANDLYGEGLHKVTEVEEQIKEHTDHLVKKIQENPLTSVLVAGGIGYLLSKLMKK